jgi:hypothetical protein
MTSSDAILLFDFDRSEPDLAKRSISANTWKARSVLYRAGQDPTAANT